MIPVEARNKGRRPFFKQGEIAASSGSYESLATFQVPDSRRGLLIDATGRLASGAVADDLLWKLEKNGGQGEDVSEIPGTWSALDRPRFMIWDLEPGDVLELLVKDPTTGRKIQGSISGFTWPAGD